MKMLFIALVIAFAIGLLRPTKPSQAKRIEAWLLLGGFVLSIIGACFA